MTVYPLTPPIVVSVWIRQPATFRDRGLATGKRIGKLGYRQTTQPRWATVDFDVAEATPSLFCTQTLH